jgi:O-antigen biosynthesis protein WbqP
MYQRYVKRLLDVTAAITFTVLLLVPFVLIAVCIKLESKGPVFYKQKRAGKNLKPFGIYKFRTMTVDAPKNCPTNSLLNADSYITHSGRIMRKLSIDELPQVLNVFKNEMSVVGPRPVILNETGLLSERKKYGANRCKPGITGWAQVNGRDELDDIAKARMDGYYVQNYGFITDLKCILKTFTVILLAAGHREGYEQNHNERIVGCR